MAYNLNGICEDFENWPVNFDPNRSVFSKQADYNDQSAYNSQSVFSHQQTENSHLLPQWDFDFDANWYNANAIDQIAASENVYQPFEDPGGVSGSVNKSEDFHFYGNGFDHNIVPGNSGSQPRMLTSPSPRLAMPEQMHNDHMAMNRHPMYRQLQPRYGSAISGNVGQTPAIGICTTPGPFGNGALGTCGTGVTVKQEQPERKPKLAGDENRVESVHPKVAIPRKRGRPKKKDGIMALKAELQSLTNALKQLKEDNKRLECEKEALREECEALGEQLKNPERVDFDL